MTFEQLSADIKAARESVPACPVDQLSASQVMRAAEIAYHLRQAELLANSFCEVPEGARIIPIDQLVREAS